MDNANAASAVSSEPKKNSSLLQRVVSALVLLPIIMLIVWLNYWITAAVVGVAVVISLHELYRTFTHGGYRPLSLVGMLTALALVVSVTVRPLNLGVDLLPPLLTLGIIASLLVAMSSSGEEQALGSWGLTLAGAIYVGWLFASIVSLRGLEIPLRPGLLEAWGMQPGAAWVFGIMAITWLQDTLAYFIGKRWGRNKLAPKLSPKKTWEGAFGGVLGAVIGALASIYIFCLPLSIPQAVLLGVVGGIVGPLGDLAESLMKRQVGIKDAGNLIPGHGGLLDRADSLLFTAPVLYYMILLIVR